jgi:hypothetical protein
MKFEQVSNQVCGSFTFNSSFDSGNLGKVELVKQTAECEYPSQAQEILEIEATQFGDAMKN